MYSTHKTRPQTLTKTSGYCLRHWRLYADCARGMWQETGKRQDRKDTVPIQRVQYSRIRLYTAMFQHLLIPLGSRKNDCEKYIRYILWHIRQRKQSDVQYIQLNSCSFGMARSADLYQAWHSGFSNRRDCQGETYRSALNGTKQCLAECLSVHVRDNIPVGTIKQNRRPHNNGHQHTKD